MRLRLELFCAGASILLAGCMAPPAAAQVPAFPGAEGAGADSLGGRGGRVIHVTTLADSGPGSFRDAVEAQGPRTIIFDIGGTIALQKPLCIRNGRITVAGQTAPGGGITLRDHGLRVAADDVVIRFIRSRLGDESGADDDAFSVVSGRRIILDHVSASWGTDETLSTSPNWKRQDDLGEVTVQWSIISESLCKAADGKPHCFGSLVGGAKGARTSYHHNLWADHGGRMPRPENLLPSGQDAIGGLFDFRSNVIYNWGSKRAGYNDGPASRVAYNFIRNSYWTGPDSEGAFIFYERDPLATAWFAGNSLNGKVLPDQWAHVPGSERPGYRLSAPIPMPPVSSDPAAVAYEDVLRLAGASLARDPVDARVVAGVRSRAGRLIRSQTEVGGWPQLARGTPWTDSDGDGMPDEWEASHGFDPRNARDGALDADRDGYTNVEEWLNALAASATP
jgi:hypothetical protein